MAVLALSNIVNISVSETQAGIGAYNVNNLAIFTRETPTSPFASGYKIYRSPTDVAADFGTSNIVTEMAIKVFSQQPNILAGGGYLAVIPMLSAPSAEKLDAAITRTKDLVQYFGVLADEIVVDADLEDAAALIQTLNKILFVAKKTQADVSPAGIFETIQLAGYDKTRCLLYINSAVDDDSVKMAAAYAGRALSTNFSGSNTTSTMHLKDLVGVNPDSAMTQTILELCKTVGADIYASFQGVPKVFSNGANKFFDQVYSLGWFIGALEVAGFNALAQSSTKVPQTEQGVSVLKGAYRSVCEQGITNQYLAPGSWTSPDTFGIQEDFIRNIGERGYYIYSLPVSQQLAADRAARKAPLIQIAVKEAGSVHSSDVLVYINA